MGRCTWPADAQDSPEEGRGMAGLEAEEHETAGNGIVVQAFAGIVLHIGLIPPEFVQHPLHGGERQDQHPMLQALLHELLKVALPGADGRLQAPQLLEKQLGAEYGKRHEDNQQPQQIRGHGHEIGRCRQQLQRRYHHARHPGSQQLRHHPDIFFQTVHRIARQELFPSIPPAFQHMREEPFPEGILGLHLVVTVPPACKEIDPDLHQQDTGKKADGRAQCSIHGTCCHVHQPLAHGDKAQRSGNSHHTGGDAHQHPPPDRPGGAPEELQAGADVFHGLCFFRYSFPDPHSSHFAGISQRLRKSDFVLVGQEFGEVFHRKVFSGHRLPQISGRSVERQHLVEVHLGESLPHYDEFSAQGAEHESFLDSHISLL